MSIVDPLLPWHKNQHKKQAYRCDHGAEQIDISIGAFNKLLKEHGIQTYRVGVSKFVTASELDRLVFILAGIEAHFKYGRAEDASGGAP